MNENVKYIAKDISNKIQNASHKKAFKYKIGILHLSIRSSTSVLQHPSSINIQRLSLLMLEFPLESQINSSISFLLAFLNSIFYNQIFKTVLKFFNLNFSNWRQIWIFQGYVNMSSQIKASFSHDGKYIVSGSENRDVYIWKTNHDYSKFSSVRRDRNDFWEAIKAHNNTVTCAIFAPNPESIIKMVEEASRSESVVDEDNKVGYSSRSHIFQSIKNFYIRKKF